MSCATTKTLSSTATEQQQPSVTPVRNHVMNGGEATCGDSKTSTSTNSDSSTENSNNTANNINNNNNNNSSSSVTSSSILATTLVQYQGFGSFHSDNVEELIRLPDSKYKKPQLFPQWAEHYPTHAEVKYLEAYTDNVEAQDYPQDVAVAAQNGLGRLALGLPTRRVRGSDEKNGDEKKEEMNGNGNGNGGKTQQKSKTNETEDGKIISLGEAVSRDHFYTDTDNWCFINHGAFGGALRGGTFIKRRWEDYMEQQPLQFVDRTVLPSIVYCLRRLATFFNCRPQDLVPASNATLALNAAINACVRHHTDVVAYLDLEYGSVWKMLREAWNWTRCTMHEIEIYPCLVDPKIMGDDEEFTKVLESKLPAQLDVMVIDHITSNSAMLLPVFTHIIPMLRRRGVSRIVVDGAHGALQFPLDFKSLREDQLPTYYAGNLHKWMCAPKSAAFMWVHPSMQHKTHSPIVTHGARAGMLSEFAWEGTKEYGAFLTVPAVLDFWERKCGVQRVRDYITTLLHDADKMLCESFGVTSVPRGAPFMRLVPLPTFFNRKIFSAKFIQDTLHKVYRVEVPVKDLQGAMYMRVSAFVYNDIHDFERLRDAVLKMRAVLRKKFATFVETKQKQHQLQQDNASPPASTNNGGSNNSSVSPMVLLTALAELLAFTNSVQSHDLGKSVLNPEFETVSEASMKDASPLIHFQQVLEAFEMLESIQKEQRSEEAAEKKKKEQEEEEEEVNNRNSRSRSNSSSNHNNNNNNNINNNSQTTSSKKNSVPPTPTTITTSSSNHAIHQQNGTSNSSNYHQQDQQQQQQQPPFSSSSSNSNGNNSQQQQQQMSGRSNSNAELDDTTKREARNLASLLVGKKPCPDSSKSGGCGVGGINTMITTAFSDTDSDSDSG